MYTRPYSLLVVTVLPLLIIRINLGTCGIDWSVIELQAPCIFSQGEQRVHNVVSENNPDECLGHSSPQISHATLKDKSEVSDSIAIVRYVEHPYTTCSFQVIHVNMHKMVY